MPAPQTIEGAIAARLAADTNVAAIIGSAAIRPATDPTPAPRPRLYYSTVTVQRLYSNDGPHSLTQALIYYYATTDDLLTAKLLARAVRQSVEGFRGQLGELKVASTRCAGPVDETAEPTPGQPKPHQRVRLEITVDYHD